MGYEWVPQLLAMLKGIEPYEVRQVLEDQRPRWPRRAVGGGIQVLAVWGRTRARRHIIVVLRPTDVNRDWLIIGAMEMTAEQAAEYDQWEANREQH